MKSLKSTIVLAVLVLSLAGCSKFGTLMSDAHYTYIVNISFMDTKGNDLILPLAEERWMPDESVHNWTGAINPDRYGFDVIFSKQWRAQNEGAYSELWITKYDEKYQSIPVFGKQFTDENRKYYLGSGFSAPSLACFYDDSQHGMSRQDYIICKISCPTIFGDSVFHELITHWSYDNVSQVRRGETGTYEQFPKCIGATFDGNEIPVKEANKRLFIDIVLDK